MSDLTEPELRAVKELAARFPGQGLPPMSATIPPSPPEPTDDLSRSIRAGFLRRRAEWEAQLEQDRLDRERREAEAAERWAANAPRRAAAQAALPAAEAELERLRTLEAEALDEVIRLRREATE